MNIPQEINNLLTKAGYKVQGKDISFQTNYCFELIATKNDETVIIIITNQN